MEISTEELARLIEQLRARDRDFRVFGSPSHRYKLGPKWGEAQLREFEARHQIALPADYRAFLREIGDGGAGPYYGLLSLQDALDECDLAREFPFVEATNFSEAQADEFYERELPFPGMLRFCHHGCGIYSELIVKGPAYGTVWGGEYYDDIHPTGQSFSLWYGDWAQRRLQILTNESLIKRVKIGMSQAEVAAAIPAAWKERESSYEPKIILNAAQIPFFVELDLNRVVVNIKPWPFI